MLRQLVNNCETFALHKKTPPKPAVGLPLSTDFNNTVTVDLHELETNVWYLHIIDEHQIQCRCYCQEKAAKCLCPRDVWVSKVLV